MRWDHGTCMVKDGRVSIRRTRFPAAASMIISPVDLRYVEHSTILYKSDCQRPELPILRKGPPGYIILQLPPSSMPSIMVDASSQENQSTYPSHIRLCLLMYSALFYTVPTLSAFTVYLSKSMCMLNTVHYLFAYLAIQPDTAREQAII